MGVSITTVEALRAAGHDAVHLREEGLIRLPDREIVAKAAREGRIVLTFDLDFCDILAVSRSEGRNAAGVDGGAVKALTGAAAGGRLADRPQKTMVRPVCPGLSH
jgi:Domain of unknown function (DUF5615)